jgi:hypothetical protein
VKRKILWLRRLSFPVFRFYRIFLKKKIEKMNEEELAKKEEERLLRSMRRAQKTGGATQPAFSMRRRQKEAEQANAAPPQTDTSKSSSSSMSWRQRNQAMQEEREAAEQRMARDLAEQRRKDEEARVERERQKREQDSYWKHKELPKIEDWLLHGESSLPTTPTPAEQVGKVVGKSAARASPLSQHVCPTCKKSYGADVKFCLDDGTALSSGRTQSQVQANSSSFSSSSSTPLVVAPRPVRTPSPAPVALASTASDEDLLNQLLETAGRLERTASKGALPMATTANVARAQADAEHRERERAEMARRQAEREREAAARERAAQERAAREAAAARESERVAVAAMGDSEPSDLDGWLRRLALICRHLNELLQSYGASKRSGFVEWISRFRDAATGLVQQLEKLGARTQSDVIMKSAMTFLQNAITMVDVAAKQQSQEPAVFEQAKARVHQSMVEMLEHIRETASSARNLQTAAARDADLVARAHILTSAVRESGALAEQIMKMMTLGDAVFSGADFGVLVAQLGRLVKENVLVMLSAPADADDKGRVIKALSECLVRAKAYREGGRTMASRTLFTTSLTTFLDVLMSLAQH